MPATMHEKFRAFQNEASREAVDALKGREAPGVLIVAPTGAGKTGIEFVSAGAYLDEVVPDGQGLILVNRIKLLKQVSPWEGDRRGSAEIWAGGPVGRIGDEAKVPNDQEKRLVCAMVQTVAGWIRNGEGHKLKDYKVVVCDEGHHAFEAEDPQSDYSVVMDYFEARGAVFLGASATPWPSQGSRLDRRFENAKRIEIPFERVQEEGLVVPPKTSMPSIANMRGVTVDATYRDLAEKHGHTIALGMLPKAIDRLRDDNFHDDAVRYACHNHHGESQMWFADDIADVKKITASMRRTGLLEGRDFVEIHGSEGSADDAAIERYRAGEIAHIVSCRMLTEGFDAPITSVVNIFNKMTNISLATQMAGRAERVDPANPGKLHASCNDFGGTAFALGPLESHIRRQSDMLRVAEDGTGGRAFNSWRPIGNGWRAITDGALNHYVRKVPAGFEVWRQEVGNGKSDGGRVTRIHAGMGPGDFTAFTIAKIKESDFMLAREAMLPTAKGAAAGARTALDEFEKRKIRSGREMDDLASMNIARKKSPAEAAAIDAKKQALLFSDAAAAGGDDWKARAADFAAATAKIVLAMQREEIGAAEVEAGNIMVALARPDVDHLALAKKAYKVLKDPAIEAVETPMLLADGKGHRKTSVEMAKILSAKAVKSLVDNGLVKGPDQKPAAAKRRSKAENLPALV